MGDDADLPETVDAASCPEIDRARTAFCRHLGPAFATVGQHLWVTGNMVGGDRVSGASPFGFGDDAAVGVGLLAEIASELTSGSIALLDMDGTYGAMALIRQLVEVEYLLWAFANDKQEAESWLRSTKAERFKKWSPKHLRERAGDRFRGKDYGDHCEIGGHPTPSARLMLRGHSVRRDAAFCWLELAIHGRSSWDYLVSAIGGLVRADWHVDQLRELADVSSLLRAGEQWIDVEPVSDRGVDLSAAPIDDGGQ